jgi:CDP-diacylglycerol--glycerol-3-phosphate 3-phosphatidyltransferase
MLTNLPPSQPQSISTMSRPLPRAAFLAATSLTFLKPRFKMALRPLAARLARFGATANQVTLTSLAGSILVGSLLCVSPSTPLLFAMLPIWLLARMACATIDGTLAIEYGQKSRLGGVLNEVGDAISDVALFLPLAFVPPFTTAAVSCVICLILVCELAGIVGLMLGSTRRLEGPLGKADRSILLSIIAMSIVVLGRLPKDAFAALPAIAIGLIVTIWNRIRFALIKSGTEVEAN